jgi:hypothetical protein
MKLSAYILFLSAILVCFLLSELQQTKRNDINLSKKIPSGSKRPVPPKRAQPHQAEKARKKQETAPQSKPSSIIIKDDKSQISLQKMKLFISAVVACCIISALLYYFLADHHICDQIVSFI